MALAAVAATGDFWSDVESVVVDKVGGFIGDAARDLVKEAEQALAKIDLRATENSRGWDWDELANSFDAFGQWVGGGIAKFQEICAPISEFMFSTVGNLICTGITFIPGIGSVAGGIIGAVKGFLKGGLDGMAEEALLGALPFGAGAVIKACGGFRTIGMLAQGQLEEAAVNAAGAAIKQYLPSVGGMVANQAQAMLGTIASQFGTDTISGLLPDVDTSNLEGFAQMIQANVKIELPSPEKYALSIARGLVADSGAPATGPFDGMSFEAATGFRSAGGTLSAAAESAFYTEAMARAGDAAFQKSASNQAATLGQMAIENQGAMSAARAIPAGSDPIVADGMTARQLLAFKAAGGFLSPASQNALYTANQAAAGNAAFRASAAAQSKTWAEVGPSIQAAMVKANATPKGSGPIITNGWTLPQIRAYYDAGGRLTNEMRTALMQAASAATSKTVQAGYAHEGGALSVDMVAPPRQTITLAAVWPPGMTLSQAIDAWELYFEA